MTNEEKLEAINGLFPEIELLRQKLRKISTDHGFRISISVTPYSDYTDNRIYVCEDIGVGTIGRNDRSRGYYTKVLRLGEFELCQLIDL